MPLAAITSANAIVDQTHQARESSAFQETGKKLQSQQLDNAKNAANAVDTVRLSGVGKSPELSSDVSVLSRHLRSGDLSAAQTAYLAIQRDLKASQRQQTDPGKAALAAGSPTTTAASAAASGEAAAAAKAGAPPDGPDQNSAAKGRDKSGQTASSSGRTNIDLSA